MNRLFFISVIAIAASLAGAPGLCEQSKVGPEFDPFVAIPDRLQDGIYASIRFNSIPDNSVSAKGTQVSVNPLELQVYKKFKWFAPGISIPAAFNPDRSPDDYVLPYIRVDARFGAFENDSFRLCAGVYADIALNVGIKDTPSFPNRDISTTFFPYVLFAYRIAGFSPQINVMWHQPIKVVNYAPGGLWYQDTAQGFSVDVVVPYHFKNERVTVMVEFNLDRDTSHGISRAFVTPSVRFFPAKSMHFGFAMPVPVLDNAFTQSNGFGLMGSFGWEFP